MEKYIVIRGGFINNGPECRCGNRDWFLKGENDWKCSYCERIRHVAPRGFIVNEPECRCGNKDWFAGNDIVRCSY